MSKSLGNPKFQIESDQALIVLGNSERKEVGDFFARTLDERKIFEDIEVLTLNRSAALIGRAAVRKAMESSTVITHSAGIMRVPRALQIIAINPPEPVPLPQLVKRALIDLPKEQIVPEAGAHKTGLVDMFKAGFELARSPIATAKTMLGISGGFSSTDRLVSGSEDFPAGRAMVHSELDAFGFAELADLGRAAASGVVTVEIPDHYHNEILFAPERTLDQLTELFPAH